LDFSFCGVAASRELLQCRFLSLSLFPLFAFSPSFLSVRLLLAVLPVRAFLLCAFLVVVSAVVFAHFAFESDALRVLRGGDPGDVAAGVEGEPARNASHRDTVVLRLPGPGGRMAFVECLAVQTRASPDVRARALPAYTI
jgi:hypothetical protein